jgi:hypothetical protein
VRLAKSDERRLQVPEEAARRTAVAAPFGGVVGDHGCAERDGRGRQRATGWIGDRLVQVDRRRFDHSVYCSGAEVGEGPDCVSRLVDSPSEPGEHRGLGRPGNRECRSGEDDGQPDGGKRERDRSEQRTEVAIRRPREERRGEQSEREGSHEHRPSAFIAGEERYAGHAREDTRDDAERCRQAREALCLAGPVQADRRCDVQRREEAGEQDPIPIRRLAVHEEDCDLRDAGNKADGEKPWPVAFHGDRRRGCEDDAGEGRPDRRQLVLEQHHHRDERRPDQPDPGYELGAPDERGDEPDRCDSGGDCQGAEVRDELVERRRGDEGRITAGNSGADGAVCRVHWPEPPMQPEAAAEDEQ